MTTDQLSLLAPTRPSARAADPDTSHAALPSHDYLSRLQAEILAVFVGGVRLTDDELCRTRFPRLVAGTVIKRRSELARAGLLRDTGYRRQVRGTGRMAVVWATTKGAGL